MNPNADLANLAFLQSLLTSSLDSIQALGHGRFEAVFRVFPNSSRFELSLFVDEDGTFNVGSSSTAPTACFLAFADLNTRAAAFVRAAGLTPS